MKDIVFSSSPSRNLQHSSHRGSGNCYRSAENRDREIDSPLRFSKTLACARNPIFGFRHFQAGGLIFKTPAFESCPSGLSALAGVLAQSLKN
jgi:hypothetical protein